MNPPLPPNVRRLLAARAARSVGQGATVASFSLYLHALGFGGAAIGTVLMAALVFSALLTVIIGPLSDRHSRRALLIGYEVAAALAAFAAMVSRHEAVLIAAATVGAFGRGANGAAGPFSPVEQAWLAREVEGDARRRAFTMNATLGFLGMGAGCALVALPALFGGGFNSLASYRALFALPLAGSLTALVLLARTRDAQTSAAHTAPPLTQAHEETHLRREENRRLRRLAGTTAINGFAIGVIGPMIAYWFLKRFAEGPATIGPALAASFVFATLGSVLNGWLSRRFGAVRSIVWMRLVGVCLLFSIPFSPTFTLAAGLYALRAAFNRGTAGARQLVAAGLTRAQRRGLAASVQSLSLQLPRAVGPILGGWLINRGEFIVPFVIAGLLQLVYLYFYRLYFLELDEEA